jgi:hypothetical protein
MVWTATATGEVMMVMVMPMPIVTSMKVMSFPQISFVMMTAHELPP